MIALARRLQGELRLGSRIVDAHIGEAWAMRVITMSIELAGKICTPCPGRHTADDCGRGEAASRADAMMGPNRGLGLDAAFG